MRVALDRMGDVKGVLNRFFTNEDLFDEKMDMKEQKVQKVVVQQQNGGGKDLVTPNIPQSRDGKGQKIGNQNKLKPINSNNSNNASRVKNDDEDFWKAADFKSRN